MDELFIVKYESFTTLSVTSQTFFYFTVCSCAFVLFCGSRNYKEAKCGLVIGNYFLKIRADPKLMHFPLKTVHSLSPEAFKSR